MSMRFPLFILCMGLCGLLKAQTAAERLSVINQVLPSEKIYVHTDRSLYSTSDEIYFKVYVANGESHRPGRTSHIVSVNLIDAKGNVKETRHQLLTEGKASGCFQLVSVPGGRYKIKAFTNWTGNQGEEYIFEKEITVHKPVYASLLLKMETALKTYVPGQRVDAWLKATDLDNKPITQNKVDYEVNYQSQTIHKGTATTNAAGKAVFSFDIPGNVKVNDLVLIAYVEHEGKKESVFKPVVLNLEKISVDFLPEGGQLVSGLPATVAFRAIKSNGKPVEVQGVVTDESNRTVAEFSSLKYGMGKFDFTPQPGHTYTAKVKAGGKTEQKIALPGILPTGITMQCRKDDAGQHWLSIWSDKSQEVSLFWYAHGEIHAERDLSLGTGENVYALPTDSISPGIARLTLFKDQRPVCERLVFVNADKTLNVAITTDREKYAPFEKVEMKVQVKDHLDRPVKGNFSLAVVDDKNLTLADDKQDNILSSLLMSSELNGKIEDPGIYFRKDEPLAPELLDLVMLTHGWRRYKWNEVWSMTAEDWKSKVKFQPDSSGYAASVYLDGYEPVKGGIQVAMLKPRKVTVYADTNGRFFLPVSDSDFPAKLRFRKNGYAEKMWVRKEELAKSGSQILYAPLGKPAGDIQSVEIIQQKEVIKSNVTTLTREIQHLPARNAASIAELSVDLYGNTSGNTLDAVEIVSYRVPLINADGCTVERLTMSRGVYSYQYGYGCSQYDYFSSGDTYFRQSRFSIRPSGYYQHYNKEFYSPVYSSGINSHTGQNDVRTTLYWNHDVATDLNGKASVVFYTCKNVTSYSAILEGCSDDGRVGAGSSVFYVQKPLSIETKLPLVVTRGDEFIARCVISNRTTKEIDAAVLVSKSADFRLSNEEHSFDVKIPADSFVVREIPFRVLPVADKAIGQGKGHLSIVVTSGIMVDDVKQEITVNKAGFDYSAAVSGNEKEKVFSFEIKDPMNTDFSARLDVLTNTCRDLDNSLKGMIREPHGCFEQVSSSNYPNILALQYLRKKGMADPELERRSMDHLNSGYKQLARYETPEGGFEWYGRTPPHEALTAFGLMQFHEMKKLGVEVDEKLVERTIQWLMSRRTASGIFMQNQGKYGFSSAPRNTSSAYITYALSCLGEKNLDKEIAAIEEDLKTKFDFYKTVLLANTCFKLGHKQKAEALVEKLVEHIKTRGIDRIETGPSFTYSYYPVVENIALLILAISENRLDRYKTQVTEYLAYIHSKRSAYGCFGSTQQTVIALSAIMAANDFLENDSKAKSGEMFVDINGTRLPAYRFDPLTDINDLSLGQYLVKGTNTIKLVCSVDNENAPAWTFGANWKEVVPETVPNNKLNISISSAKNEYTLGEAARLNVSITNTTNKGLPQTVAIIGIPGGMGFDTQELRRLMDDKLFDYYEIKDNYLVLYYAEMAPAAVIDIPLNLKTDVPGTFSAPPACVYLYYNPEYKCWSTTNTVTVR